jgi:DNA repair exonuclease SbcCD ATPase subunit
MIKLQKIEMQNFMSFGNKPTSIDLDKKQTVLIVGNNEDIGDSGKSKNGVGKTVTNQAIIFALYGKGIEKELKTDDFINNINEKKLVVQLWFSVNGVSFRILRGRKPNTVELFRIDGDEEVSLTRDTMANTDKYIVNLIGMEREVFIGTYFLSPHIKPFMAMSTPEQRSFIESVLSLDILAKRAESLKLVRKDVQVDLKLAQRDLETAESSNEKTQQKIDAIESKMKSWNETHESEVKELEEELSDLSDLDFKQEEENLKKIEDLQEQLREANSELKSLDVEGGDESEKNAIRSNIESLNDKISSIKRDIKRYEDATEKAEKYISEIQTEITHYKKELDEFKFKTIDEIDEKIKEVESLESKESSANQKIREYEVSLKHKEKDSERLISQMDELTEEIETLESGKCPYCNQKHVDQELITAKKEKLGELEEESVALVDDIEVHENLSEEVEKEITKIHSAIDELPSVPSLKMDRQNLVGFLEGFKKNQDKLEQPNPHQHAVDTFEEDYGSVEAAEKIIDDCLKEISNQEKSIRKIDNRIQKKQEEIKNKKHEIEEISDKISEAKENTVCEDFSELQGFIHSKDKVESELTNLKKQVNPFIEQLNDTKELLSDVDEYMFKVEEQEKREKHIGYLIKLLTDPKSFVRKNIIDQYIPFLNKKILEYTTKIDLPHVAEIRSDLTVDITNMQRNTTYYNMSQGQRLRLNVATTLAFRDLMQMMGKSCNMVMIDEMLDSALDPSGIMKVFHLIKGCADHTWLISHRDDLAASADKTMTVTLNNGFSSIDIR